MKKNIIILLMIGMLSSCNNLLPSANSESETIEPTTNPYELQLGAPTDFIVLDNIYSLSKLADPLEVKSIIIDYYKSKMPSICEMKIEMDLFESAYVSNATMLYTYSESDEYIEDYYHIISENLKTNIISELTGISGSNICKNHSKTHFKAYEKFVVSNELYHAAYQEFDEENNKYITGSLNKNEIMLPLDDKHANDYNTARYALQLYTNQSSIKNLFTEYNEFKDYYEYSYEYYENYIILKSINPFGFYLGENESFKMMALASIENNYSIETSLYFNVNTLQVDKLTYSYKGITISPMLGSYSEVKFELVNSSKNNEDINVLVDELKTTVKNSCSTN